jgi:hypothetical protein
MKEWSSAPGKKGRVERRHRKRARGRERRTGVPCSGMDGREDLREVVPWGEGVVGGDGRRELGGHHGWAVEQRECGRTARIIPT